MWEIRGGIITEVETDTRRPTLLDRFTLLMATGFGVGRLPRAPGTFGSLLGLPLAWGLLKLPPLWQYVAVPVLFAIGVPICGRAARLLHSKDPGGVVFDEIAAIPLMFLFVPFRMKFMIVGFLLFRLFDIWKPWPCRAVERLPGGLGIMADDFVASVYATATLWCVAHWLLPG